MIISFYFYPVDTPELTTTCFVIVQMYAVAILKKGAMNHDGFKNNSIHCH
ncbi:hypothetical protein DFQ00_107156 [Paenibacillus barcinonensis]|uniref:Uncharacterized protein n=1 Tax=Paenibacillus barcinonensis TaxID=198119 RepID=A0A2V4VR47_PAEBA|nr:hypothetical protein DFQ00_107156 [Paenibacillus barcinonensis]